MVRCIAKVQRTSTNLNKLEVPVLFAELLDDCAALLRQQARCNMVALLLLFQNVPRFGVEVQNDPVSKAWLVAHKATLRLSNNRNIENILPSLNDMTRPAVKMIDEVKTIGQRPPFAWKPKLWTELHHIQEVCRAGPYCPLASAANLRLIWQVGQNDTVTETASGNSQYAVTNTPRRAWAIVVNANRIVCTNNCIGNQSTSLFCE